MLRLATLCTAGLFLAQSAPAQEPAPAESSPTALELKSLRETVQLQQQQLDQISHKLDDVLHRLGAKATAVAPAAAEHSAPEAPAPAETPKEAPKAQLAEGQSLHVVKKGETLTAIARQNGLTVDELQKANHITDGRRLQIDQNLIIPASTASKPASPSPEPSAH